MRKFRSTIFKSRIFEVVAINYDIIKPELIANASKSRIESRTKVSMPI